MSTLTKREHDEIIRGQERFLELLLGGLSSVALRCALQLNIADIINSHDGPITLSQIAQGIGSTSLNLNGLSRLMRFLVRKQIFDEVRQAEHEEPLYSLNQCSLCLLKDKSDTLAPYGMEITTPHIFSCLCNLNLSIKEGGTTSFKTYGYEIWDLLNHDPQENKSFNESMACLTAIEIDAIMSSYDFSSLKGTLVDVAGGIGVTLNKIVTTYPHLKGINFDLPRVISSAPSYEGVSHVEGDMLTYVPPGDSFLIKKILHNWGDDKCVQLLRNCGESMINKRSGKVIIVDIILNPKGEDVFDEVRINMDMVMLAFFDGGKERTEVEWKKVLEEAGFPHYNFIKTPSFVSIIEAYME
ncbi:hypothetical protein SSX86_001509 [Deinandra increscens subsp. villosa]|uniref:O-methyltransferase n=1 Tax=Deinandra increscens subsp. villosa TaxID=3103831 RepID=A0AAP0DRU5_9ASTR